MKSENPPYRFGVDQENDLNEGDSWFGRNKATNHKQWIFPVYTTKHWTADPVYESDGLAKCLGNDPYDRSHRSRASGAIPTTVTAPPEASGVIPMVVVASPERPERSLRP